MPLKDLIIDFLIYSNPPLVQLSPRISIINFVIGLVNRIICYQVAMKSVTESNLHTKSMDKHLLQWML